VIELKPGLEPDSKKLLDFLNNSGQKEIEQLTAEEARQLLSTLQQFGEQPLPAADIEDRTIPCGQLALSAAKGQALPIRIIRPPGNRQRLPAVLYFHGGGWVLGAKEDFDRAVREIAVGSGAAVVFVEYSRAPEAKFPIAVEECYAAAKYIAENGAALNLDAARLAVAGDSAGGNLSAVVAQLAKQRGGPAIALQVLINPATDATSDTPSVRDFAEGYFLTLEAMKWFGRQYFKDPAEPRDPKASPLLATLDELRGLPPAVVITSEFDPLRDQGEAYARKLSEAGVAVAAVRYLGTIHGFTILNALANTASSRSAVAFINAHLKHAFAEAARPFASSA
jgi:acetyl esterase